MRSSVYRRLQYLSIDIVFGALILLRFFSTALSVTPSPYVYLLLGSSVWLVYTLDHLRDAKRAEGPMIRERYQFHLRNESVLKIVALIVSGSSVALVFFLDSKMLVAGVCLTVFVIIYLLIQDKLSRNGFKELYVAVIYSSGVLLAPFVLSERIDWYLLLNLVLLTFSNLVLFSWFERDEDKADSFQSIATVLSEQWMMIAIYFTLSFGLAQVFLSNFSIVSSYFFVGFSTYALLFLRDRWARTHQRYRTLGDGVFLLPMLFEWL